MADPVTLLAIGSTALSSGGALLEGSAKAKAAEFSAAQLERKAKMSKALATRRVQGIKEQGKKFLSDARTAMVASGGVSTDAGALEGLGDIEEKIDYNILSAIFEGDLEAQGMQNQASAARYGGRMAKRAGLIKGFSTALGGASGAFSSFSGGG